MFIVYCYLDATIYVCIQKSLILVVLACQVGKWRGCRSRHYEANHSPTMSEQRPPPPAKKKPRLRSGRHVLPCPPPRRLRRRAPAPPARRLQPAPPPSTSTSSPSPQSPWRSTTASRSSWPPTTSSASCARLRPSVYGCTARYSPNTGCGLSGTGPPRPSPLLWKPTTASTTRRACLAPTGPAVLLATLRSPSSPACALPSPRTRCTSTTPATCATTRCACSSATW